MSGEVYSSLLIQPPSLLLAGGTFRETAPELRRWEHVIIYELVSTLNVGKKQTNKQNAVSDQGHAISLV